MDNNPINRSQELCRRVVTTESFIEEAKAIYGDRYGYDKVNYKNGEHRIIVTCPIHGDFEVFAREHLDGKGCPKCAKGEKFVSKLVEKFGDKFGLDNFVYEDSQTPVELICPEHGPFRRLPNQILQSTCGCPVCINDNVLKKREDAKIQAAKRKEEKIQAINDLRQQVYDMIQDAISAYNPKRYPINAEDLVELLSPLDDTCFNQLSVLLEIEKNRRDSKALRFVPFQYRQKEFELPSSFVSIDFETLYPQRVSVCSIGMVKFKEGVIVDRYYSLIRPPYDYPGKNGVALTWIHGFSEDMLQNERPFSAILPEIEEFVEGLPLVAHNAWVERGCIKESIDYYRLHTSLGYEEIFDTLPLSRVVERDCSLMLDGPGSHSLDVVCRRFGIPTLSHHNALDDAEMCGNLMVKLKMIREGKIDFTPAPTVLPSISDCSCQDKKVRAEDKIQREYLENIADNPFKNKNVVLTGFAKALVQEYGHRLNELGAIVHDGVTKKTQILITGPNAGPSKIAKCQELGAQIISESDFLDMINVEII